MNARQNNAVISSEELFNRMALLTKEEFLEILGKLSPEDKAAAELFYANSRKSIMQTIRDHQEDARLQAAIAHLHTFILTSEEAAVNTLRKRLAVAKHPLAGILRTQLNVLEKHRQKKLFSLLFIKYHKALIWNIEHYETWELGIDKLCVEVDALWREEAEANKIFHQYVVQPCDFHSREEWLKIAGFTK